MGFLWVFYHKEYRLFFIVSEHSGCPFPVFHSVKLALHTGIRTHNVKVGNKLKANRTLTDQKRKKLSWLVKISEKKAENMCSEEKLIHT